MQLFDAFDYFGQRSRDLVEKILVARRGEQTFKSFDRTWSRLAAIHLLGCQPETFDQTRRCLLYTSPSPRDGLLSRMPSSA